MSFEFPDQIQASVTLPRDERGLTGRQCPKCEKIFKVKTGTGLTGENLPCHCAYCGHVAAHDHFFTKEQIEYVRTVAVRHFGELLHNELKKLEFDTGPQGPLGLRISMKLDPHSPGPIRYYYEPQLETDVICEKCTLVYAIYGEFAFCPDCGSHNSIVILNKNVEFVGKMLTLAEVQEPDFAQRLVGDALENLVSAFDGFGREVCLVAAPKSSNPDKARDVRFQNLVGANSAVQKLFAVDLVSFVSPDEWRFICKCFHKRHLLAHKMGVVDDDYIAQTNDPSATIGRKISVQATEVKELGALLMQLGRQFTARLIP
jgi:Zn finger protein HypA/HybF involved in hydrogenase expression